MEFKKELLTNENLVVHCPEEWQANELLKWANRNGKTWCDGNSFLKNNNWNMEKEKTCYNLSCGTYSRKSYYQSVRVTILSFEEAKEKYPKGGYVYPNYTKEIAKRLKETVDKYKENNMNETLEQLKKRQAEELKALEERKKAEEKAEAKKLEAEIEAQKQEVRDIIESDGVLACIDTLIEEIKNPKLSLRYKTLKKARNERIDEIIAIAETMKK